MAEFQKLFLDTWTRQGASLISAERHFPVLEAKGSDIVRAIGGTPDSTGSLMYLTLLSAIERSAERVARLAAYWL